ncbi:FAD/NAD(P)-binding protein [Sinomonas sp. ASV322]|uniref:FAD/NAD(P)-binding protein n=1 Tax=Sinomonas sp. ASV322 TaxID=3041920 RepID=UPI0027DCC1DB|nr:FAD/NAD(P)-binding protein [Sinomonas sp. ASV322]MDQ4503904.1 FAD/NAD(P)-binding protein [Sinomonas sp. ASV322]
MSSGGGRTAVRVAVIGGGPRGASAVERLLANWPAASKAGLGELEITVFDPFTPGSGRVWRPEQPREFLMNTPCLYPTLIPSEPDVAPPRVGGSFHEWLERRGAEADLTPDERAEAAALTSADYPPRALYGRYLAHTFAAVVAAAPEGATVEHIALEVVRLGRTPHGWAVTTADGHARQADAVVLALGHVPARPNRAQRDFVDAAARLGLTYLPPAAPADVDWDVLPAGRTVLVRGMGLNFFDVMVRLTKGRGGRFKEGPEGLEYVPSGREPRLAAASRRGVPYRGKAELGAYYAPGVRLRWFTREAALAPRAAGVTPSFDADFWPLLHRDTLWAYYSTLARSESGAVGHGFLDELQAALETPGAGWEARAERVVVAGVARDRRLDLRGLGAPLAGRHFVNRSELDAHVLAYLEDDAAGSARGEDDPVKMAIAALHRGRAVLKEVVADGGITEESWVAGLRGWFEGLVEGLASGPPAIRIQQLAALIRAGVVSTVGPEPRFAVDRGAGCFVAESPWVGGRPVYAAAMVEALAPANVVAAADSPLLTGLLADGLARPKYLAGADGVPRPASGLDVTAPPYRPLDVNGHAVPGVYVLGLQLSAVQWGTAIAAEAHPFGATGETNDGAAYPSGQRTLRDADAIARAILGLSQGLAH